MIRWREDGGSVTAEFAVALPAVVVVLALGAGVLAACERQVRLQDAAADAARLVARDEPEGRALALVSAVVAGASGSIARRGELVCVDAEAPGQPPLPMLHASSCALAGGR
jgi:Flp pilus assembly protein TadG